MAEVTHNGWGEEISRPAVTLPTVNLPDVDHTQIDRELAARLAEQKIVKCGRDAWQAINKSQSFAGWLAIGKALLVGREFALQATGANAPMGRRYSVAFSQWVNEHGFTGMQKSVRSVAIELAEHRDAITVWRDSLPERQRQRLVHPLSVTRRWRAATGHGSGRCPQDLKRDAMAAWPRFRDCLHALPPAEAAPLWQAAPAEARCHAA